MKLSQQQTQVQKQIMAPVLQQSIEMLMLPLIDLETAIEQELEENPFLEIDEAALEERRNQQPELPPVAASASADDGSCGTGLSDEIQNLINAPDRPFSNNASMDDIHDPFAFHSFEYTLEDHLLRQIHIDLDDPLKIRIAEMIIGQLNDDGYLTTTCQEIAQALELTEKNSIEEVLSLIQSYEPVGIAARDLKECLILQAEIAFNGNTPLVQQIISEHLESLGRKRYDLIAKDLKIPIEQVRALAQLVATLDPRPARNFRPISESNYIKPDLLIFADPAQQGEFLLEVHTRDIPPLRVNPVYRRLIRKKNLTVEEKEFLKDKLQNASAFIKSIQQRGSTIKAIGEYLLREQKEFFRNGHAFLKPMRLKDIAESIGRNESTVSRAIHQKHIDTPQGIFSLKYFFSQNVGEDLNGNGGTCSRCVKEDIRELVDEEDNRHPLSDSDLQDILEKKGIRIARRTISKYRHQLNILPSHLRKI